MTEEEHKALIREQRRLFTSIIREAAEFLYYNSRMCLYLPNIEKAVKKIREIELEISEAPEEP